MIGITIEALNIENTHHFIALMESVNFDATPHWASCFCQFYYSNCSMDEWKQTTKTQNKKRMIQAVKQGTMQGFLAFIDQRCIGWLNVADVNLLKRISFIIKPHMDQKQYVCAICYVIHNEYRGLGVATALLQHAMKHYHSLGYYGIFALPYDHLDNKQLEYRGPFSMYQKLGFQVLEQKENVRLVRHIF